jgi:hypothetical protein
MAAKQDRRIHHRDTKKKPADDFTVEVLFLRFSVPLCLCGEPTCLLEPAMTAAGLLRNSRHRQQLGTLGEVMHKQFTKIPSGECLAVQEALHLFAAFLTQ